jgi:hypothetical protein
MTFEVLAASPLCSAASLVLAFLNIASFTIEFLFRAYSRAPSVVGHLDHFRPSSGSKHISHSRVLAWPRRPGRLEGGGGEGQQATTRTRRRHNAFYSAVSQPIGIRASARPTERTGGAPSLWIGIGS